MKSFFTAFAFLISLSSFAGDETLLLDASCKIKCIVGVTKVVSSQSYTYKNEIAYTYVDFIGLSREQVDQKIQKNNLNIICKANFSEEASSESSDCLYFKH